MAKKIIQRFLPDPNKIKTHKSLGWLGHLIHEPNLWHLNRRSVSLAFLVGLFWAFMPMPMQMPVAAVFAIGLKANLPVSCSLVWLTNPFTMPPLFYLTYNIGAYLLDIPEAPAHLEFTLEWLTSEVSTIWQPILLGSVICGIVSGILGYISIRLFWRWHVLHNWEKRRLSRKKSLDK